jgi:enoyl-CoA hydratase/carnithine racemase
VFVVKGAGGKAFCAGGDVKTVWLELQDLRSRKGAPGAAAIGTGSTGLVHSDFFRVEYEMNYLLGTSKVPQVSLWDGIVMGGGVGISALGKYRVATDKTLFAMPETAIGLFPDVGSSFWLPMLEPRGFGLYMGLTGVRLRAADLLHAGIATHFVTSELKEELEASLCAVTDGAQILPVLDSFHSKSIASLDSSKALLPKYAQRITDTFGQASGVAHVIEMLQAAASSTNSCEWSKETVALLTKMSPTSLHVTFEQLKRGQGRPLHECLEMEFCMMMRCMAAPDFTEGIRAVLVDKDHNPKWHPAAVSDVSEEACSSFFAPLDPHNDLKLGSL